MLNYPHDPALYFRGTVKPTSNAAARNSRTYGFVFIYLHALIKVSFSIGKRRTSGRGLHYFSLRGQIDWFDVLFDHKAPAQSRGFVITLPFRQI
jgi:hypothetical protein